VEGGVVRITRSKNPKRDLAEGFEQDLFALIRCGFIHPRKKLVTNCAGRYGRKILLDIMQKNGLSAHIRAEECSLETWKQLTKSFRRNQDRGAPD